MRARGTPVGLVDLARDLLAVESPIDPGVARRVVAAALDRPPASLPERLEARHFRPPAEWEVGEAPIARARFVVVDLETTGLSPNQAAILEIGAVRVARMQTGREFQTLVRPDAPLSRAIADLTGIDDAVVADAPRPSEALRAFHRWFGRGGAPPFVAHNARFDAGFVARALERLGLPPLRVPVLCPQRLARRLLPEVGRFNLDSLCAHCGIHNPARHRALGDARATAALFVELLGIAREREGVATVGELIDLQTRPTKRGRRRRR